MSIKFTSRPRWMASAVLAAVCLASTTVFQAQAQTQPPAPLVPLTQLDVSANEYINSADAANVSNAWVDLEQDGGLCIAPGLTQFDVDKSGCIDVVDAQLVAAHMGEASGPRGAALSHGIAGAVDAGATLVVNSAGNEADTNPGDGKCLSSANTCTLRAAIQEANVLPGHETINFNIQKAGVITITPPGNSTPGNGANEPNGSWFNLDDALNNGVTIDGYSQPGASANTQDIAGNAKILIELKGQAQKFVQGINVNSSNNSIRGLAIYNWDRQIFVNGKNALYNHIEGNFLGTNAAQTSTSKPISMHHAEGFRTQYGATYNVLGCGSFDAANTFVPCTDKTQINAARNIIAGNGEDGIHIQSGSFYNHIVGNYIGLKQDGQTALRNHSDAVDFELGPQYNWLGGLTPAERNVVGGNGSEGIEISHATRTQFNSVVGNYFGMDATGTKMVSNGGNGISFEDTVDSNYAYNNVVAGNKGNGIRFYVGATRNEVHNNLIGIAPDGVTAMPNGQSTYYGQSGVFIMGGSQHNLIYENEIANHPQHGIYLSTTSDDDHNGYGPTWYNVLSKNSIHDNVRFGINGIGTTLTSANRGVVPPVLATASTRSASGTTCANCTIELFIADKTTTGGSDNNGEGKTFIGSGVADSSGAFNILTSQTAIGQILTATVTDTTGNTSQFAKNIAVTVNGDATATAIAATEQAIATATGVVLQTTADAQATTVAAVQAATAQAAATQTAIAGSTDPGAGATATAIIATAQALTQTPVASPAPIDGRFKVMLPLITR